ncbi:beta-ketoacyl-ACP synthase III [Myroides pelagicus]|uniref:StlD/DarB family beta-ketosynthase n=1 Tax=Myroides pelagicus TaxID=270914 RepID=A0A7K1GLQ4_9FLAO|nr:beta-ketoacyl-ACP synthase III [Myroides pelagicus]MEC4113292.1 beta-ketoacyl-ACP synthase III [Myroides pelagicus]MTH29459.1 StlD/DarB family beta-ketosynthase [Myroides pelagicus]
MSKVYITKSAKFLPNAAVSNDEMEAKLGKIDNKESKARRIVLRNNGIKQRYYAIDNEGIATHNNSDLTLESIKGLCDEQFTLSDIEVLSCGTSTPDHLLPSHAAMVHGLMKTKSIELNSASGVCCSGMSALKYGYLSVKAGDSNNAVCTGSERVSSWMKADRFEAEVDSLKELEQTPIIAFKKDFLRWMLSDGAAALLLEDKPRETTSLEILWMDAYSYAYELEACMYAGGDKLEDGSLKPWSDYTASEWLTESVFSLKQDVKVLNENILGRGVDSMRQTMEKHNITPADIDYFLPHVSSHYFVDNLYAMFAEAGLEITKDKWFMNLKRVGNVGSASIYLMLEELMNSGKLKSGDRIMLSVPESGRFSYAYAYLKVV